jgi:hypothetical protein
MAIGKISGVMLKDNLERQGVNLSFDGNLAYLDVTNRRLGVGTASPQYGLDVPANVRVANLTVLGNTITSNTGKIGLGSITGVVITGGSANYILKTDGAGNLSWIDANTSPAVVSLLSNIANYQAYANANAATQATGINTINGNLGAFQTYANANLSTQTTNFNTLDANVGAFETYANLSIASINSNVSNLIGNTIVLGSNSAPALVSNAVALTTSTTVTDAISKLNFVLGKLVPPSPPPFPGAGTLSLSTSTSTGRITNFTQTDNSGWGNLSVAAGTSVSATRVTTYATSTITTTGPGDSGTVTAYRNGQAVGNVSMATGSQNGTYGANLVIASDQDYSAIIGGSGGFWESFNASISGASTPAGWNRANIVHSGAASTNTITWYYDSSTPGTPTFSNTSIALNSNTVIYSSTIPHFTSSATFTIKGNIARLSGDTYPLAVSSGSSTLVTGSSATGFQTPTSVTYTAAGVTVPLARNLYVSSGSAYFETASAIATGFGSTTTGPGLSVTNNYTTGTSGAIVVSGTPTILYKTGTASLMEETTVTFGSTVGTGSGLAARIINPGTTDTPTYTANAATFNSQTSTLTANCATVVAATLKHDLTNYASGYLPVGPNLSTGRHGAQYFTFRFVRTSLSKFNIKFTGTIAGLWVAVPGSAIDTAAAATNGWVSMASAYGGAGVPSSGCALGGVVTLNSSVTAHSKTCTFGTVSTSDTATNEVYVRIKLTTGQTVTALSLETATN